MDREPTKGWARTGRRPGDGVDDVDLEAEDAPWARSSSPASSHDEAAELIRDYLERLGFGSVAVSASGASRSMRDGHRPAERRCVECYLLKEVAGLDDREIALRVGLATAEQVRRARYRGKAMAAAAGARRLG